MEYTDYHTDEEGGIENQNIHPVEVNGNQTHVSTSNQNIDPVEINGNQTHV